MIWWSSLIVLICLYLTFHLRPKRRLAFSLSFSVAPSVWPRIRAHSGKSFSIKKFLEVFSWDVQNFKTLDAQSSSAHHVMPNFPLFLVQDRGTSGTSPSPLRRAPGNVALGARKRTACRRSFLWKEMSATLLKIEVEIGRTLNQNRSVFVSKRQGKACKDSQLYFTLQAAIPTKNLFPAPSIWIIQTEVGQFDIHVLGMGWNSLHL